MRGFGPLAALLLLAACSTEPELPPPSPALWEVTGPDGAHGWLFGTAHSLPDGWDWRTPRIDAAFSRSDLLVVEVDLGSGSRSILADLSRTAGLGTPSSRVDPDKRAQVATAFAEAGLSERDFLDTESWAAALALAQEYAVGESRNGVDRALIARREKRPLVELEGFARQLGIFDRLPAAEQADMLEIVASGAAGASQESERQIKAWRAGDTATIEAAMETGLLADPELRAALLSGRNEVWAQKIDRLLKDRTRPFVAVGAAHLLGDEGLPTLLKARGYTVRRIQ